MYRSFRVLVVEDDPNDRTLMAYELSTRFAGVAIRQEWERAGFKAALDEPGFDLVITDYDLGWSNGLDLLKQVKERWPSTPVIVFSGNPCATVAREAAAAGAIRFVEKSSRGFAELLATVERLWADLPGDDRSR